MFWPMSWQIYAPFAPDHHLVLPLSAFLPRDDFWANPNYPDVDFADSIAILRKRSGLYRHSLEQYNVSMQYGSERPKGAGKPVIRGETGFVVSGARLPQANSMRIQMPLAA